MKKLLVVVLLLVCGGPVTAKASHAITCVGILTYFPVHPGGVAHGALVAPGGLFLPKQSQYCDHPIVGRNWNKVSDACPRAGTLCRVVGVWRDGGWKHIIKARAMKD
jgi:hypothetical protein